MKDKKVGADFPSFYQRNETAINQLNVKEIATSFSAILNDLVAFEDRSFRAEKDFS
jgi:hypothetical protein